MLRVVVRRVEDVQQAVWVAVEGSSSVQQLLAVAAQRLQAAFGVRCAVSPLTYATLQGARLLLDDCCAVFVRNDTTLEVGNLAVMSNNNNNNNSKETEVIVATLQQQQQQPLLSVADLDVTPVPVSDLGAFERELSAFFEQAEQLVGADGRVKTVGELQEFQGIEQTAGDDDDDDDCIKVLCTAVALYNFTPEEDDEIAFKPGDEILVYRKRADGWWKGRLVSKGGKEMPVGYFPGNRVKELQVESDDEEELPEASDSSRSSIQRSSVASVQVTKEIEEVVVVVTYGHGSPESIRRARSAASGSAPVAQQQQQQPETSVPAAAAVETPAVVASSPSSQEPQAQAQVQQPAAVATTRSSRSSSSPSSGAAVARTSGAKEASRESSGPAPVSTTVVVAAAAAPVQPPASAPSSAAATQAPSEDRPRESDWRRSEVFALAAEQPLLPRRSVSKGGPGSPTDAESQRLLQQAARHVEQQQFAEAKQLVTAVVDAFPGYAGPYFTRGQINERLKCMQEAIADYSRAIQMRPRYLEALLARGRLAALAQRHKIARHDFLAALVCSENKSIEAMLGAAQAEEGLNNTNEAIRLLEMAVETDSRRVASDAFIRLATLLKRSGNTRRAVEVLQLATEGSDSSARLWTELASCLVELKWSDDALQAASRALERDAQLWSAWRMRGLAHSQKRAWQEAIAAFDEAIKLNSGSASLYMERAVALTRCPGQEEKALSDWRSAVQMKPDDAWLRAGLAAALKNSGNYREAVDQASRAVALDPQQGRVWMCRGEARVKLMEMDAAVTDLTRALELDSQNCKAAYYFRALAHQHLKKHDAALADIEQFLQHKSDSANAKQLQQLILQSIAALKK